MSGIEELLIRLLAETDAAFCPMRLWSRPIPSVIYERRRDFHAFGLPWRSGGSDEPERRRLSRTLQALVDARLAVAHRPRGLKTLFSRLTDGGDETARRLARLPGIDAAVASLGALVALQDHPWSAAGDGGCAAIPETLLTGCDYGADGVKEALLTVEVMALPALCRGWIESNSDLAGHVYYWPTERGLAALSSPPSIELVRRRPSKHGAALYDSELVRAREALFASEPRTPREIGYLPLSASVARKGAPDIGGRMIGVSVV